MSYDFTIALDAMGGDYGPDVTIPGAAKAQTALPGASFLIFGDENRISQKLNLYPELTAVSEIHHTTQVVRSEDKPSAALRNGRNSSMRLAVNAVSDGDAACIVSGGNTGALMAISKLVLKTLPGIHRPAIASVFPTMRGETVMLDLGANVSCDDENLVQFAILGAVLDRAVRGVERPRVGLLNIGVEEMKGNDQVRSAANVLRHIDFPGRFEGFIEGNDIPKGTVDVVVTDGFTGNVAIKVAEGVGKMMDHYIKDAFKSSPLAMLGALLSYPALRKLKNRIDPRHYNGGMFLGLDGVCVKSHGGSDSYGFSRAIITAAEMVRHGFNKKVAAEIEHLASQESFLMNTQTLAEE